MSASTLFDKLRQEVQLSSDAALARWLDIEPSDLSRARKKGRVSDRMILRIHEYSGWPVVDIRDLLKAQTAPQQYHDNPGQVSRTAAHQ